MTQIKKIFAQYEKAEKISNDLYEALEQDPMNEELESKWDAAYEKEYAAHEALVNEIIKITSGMIDRETAKAMIGKKRAELKNLISRLAA